MIADSQVQAPEELSRYKGYNMMETVTVDTVQGTLRGKKATSKVGRTYYSFQGVPFAKPPQGLLRFKAPQPPEPWSGVRDALKEGEKCTQLDFFRNTCEGSEDCLYLNVYTPKLPTKDSLLPVIFAIHGGGFIGGSGNTEFHGPDFFMKEDIVLVSPTYRVGILGFLCLDDAACPGNMGLKDQVAALRWTQQNIAKFGGDPNNVTIIGGSAGGASVHYQLLSPMSKGLFHKAISSSGSALNPWAFTRHPREMAFQVGAALGCTSKDSKELVEFLRSVDHLELVKAVYGHGTLKEEKARLFNFLFTPTVEVEVEGVERFLPAHPLQLLQEGRFNAVPSISGVASEEALVMVDMIKLRDHEGQDKLNRDFDSAILPNLRLPENYSNSQQISSKIKSYYLDNKPLSDKTLLGFVHLLSDILFNEGDILFVKLMAQHAKAPVYQYCFSFDGKVELKIPLGLDTGLPGVTHCADALYMFTSAFCDGDIESGTPEATTRERLFKFYTDFGRTGNPTPAKSELIPVIWEPHSATNPFYMDIDKELSLKKNFLGERMAFWKQLYESVKS